ncbi:MAG: radical SAM protein, partial [Caldilineaceae bacterium]|nr:radical SAM protein [Caldilineaceae bacterium]
FRIGCGVCAGGAGDRSYLAMANGELLTSVAAAQGQLTDCTLCPHRCGPARATARGVCRVGQASYIASEMLHIGEEALLHPAHAIFFSGCTATCRFCTAAKIAFRPTYGVVVTPAQLAQRMVQRQEQGARSICFIVGDPAPHIPFILATLAVLGERKRVPAVFNSNFYLTDVALDLLAGAIDIYLPDLKFGPGTGPTSCGERLGSMPDYWQVVTGCIDRLYGEGRRLLVRHLLMPGHFDCCTVPVLHWLADRPGIEVSLLTQYIAPAHAKGELAAPLDSADIISARDLATALNLKLVNG